MRSKLLFPFILLLVSWLALIENERQTEALKPAPTEAMPNEAYLQDFERTKDPSLGYPTPERLIPVLKQVSAYRLQANKVPGQTGFPWSERGPFDTGGRTRAIMFDPSDASAKKVWAGGVTGGLWYNNDITSATSQWQKVDDFWSNLTVTCIAFDPNNTQTFYVGTGESFTGSSRGAGIWKSTDGGLTWAQLSSTTQFYYVNDIAVRDEGATSAVLAGVTARYYQGTYPSGGSANAGLQRSTNGGTSWTQVLPNIPGQSFPAAASDIEIDASNNVWIGSNASPYALSNRGGGTIYKSTNGTSYTAVYTASVTNGSGRVELACAPSDANYVYALIENLRQVHEIVKTSNGGTTWSSATEPSDADNGIPSTDFSRNQASYDLIAAVHPTDKNQLIVGAIDLFRTTDGGANWSQISKWSNNPNLNTLPCSIVHADQHQLVFRPGYPNELMSGNDGGIYYCTDLANAANAATFEVRNTNYNVTQFYANAMSPTVGENTYLAGAQDNGTQHFKSFGKASTSGFSGGDGAYCFIDQNEPNIMISAYVYNNYYYSLDGGQTVDRLLRKSGGSFINPAAYDNNLNILYSAEGASYINKITLPASQGPLGTVTVVPLAIGNKASAFAVSPHTTTSTTLFVGTGGGDVFKVTNADGGSGTPTPTNIGSGSFPSGTVNNIYIGSSEQELVAVFSNYGVSSVWYTSNGGTTWVEKEGDLPDMPIRWFLLNPNISNEAIVATEVGVWRTANFTAASPNWVPSTSGLANVRVDMLQIRDSDDQVAAATFGRGLFTSDAFSEQIPVALFEASPLSSAVGVPVTFTDQSAGLPTSWAWTISPANYTLLNGTTLNSQNPEVAFTQTGTYTIGLTATNAHGSSTPLTKTNYIQVNALHSIPYTQDFDAFTVNVSPDFSCNFTDALSADWINETNGSGDDSDWLTHQGSTSSSGTGPSADHTLGTSVGKYLYTESSGCSSGVRMVLNTPFFDLVNKSADTLIFYRHMYGSSMGTLNVSAILNGEKQVLWSQSGNKGNQWDLVKIDITALNGNFVSFEFEAEDVQNFTSDMAIDDFSITELASPALLWDGGAATTAWSDALNWSTDAVPTATDQVILDNTYVTGNYTINMASTQVIKDLEIDMGSNAVSFSGSDSLKVTTMVTPTSGTLNANGQLVLFATSESVYAQIGTGAGTISGNVINQWYFNGSDGFRHIASPVVCNLNELADDFLILNYASGITGSIFNWDASTSNWSVPASGSSTSFNKAVSVFMGSNLGHNFSDLPLRLDAAGTVVTGNTSQALAFSSGVSSGITFQNGTDGWNFVYNPYPSTLQWSLVEADASYPTQLASTYYYWDPNLGAYASYNPTSGGVNGGTDFIPKGRAFWLQASATPSGLLNFTDAMRNSTEVPAMKTYGDELHNKLTISATSNTARDEAYYGEISGATLQYNKKYDHLKMNGKRDAQVYIQNRNHKMSFNTIGQLNYPLPFTVLSNKTVQVSINVEPLSDFTANRPAYIYNNATGQFHDLQDGPLLLDAVSGKKYNFQIVRFKNEAMVNAPNAIKIYASRQTLHVEMTGSNQYEKIEVIDLLGRVLVAKDLEKDIDYLEIPMAFSGTYIVRLIDVNGAVISKKISLVN